MKKVKDITMVSPEASKRKRQDERSTGWPGTPLPDLHKEAMMGGFLDELSLLEQVDLVKIADDVSTSEAAMALRHLKKLEKRKPEAGELVRGAAVGSVVAPLAGAVSDVISPKAVTQGPAPKIKFLRRFGRGGRTLAARAVTGAMYGSLLPVGRHLLEREVKKQKLRDYLGDTKGGKTRRTVKRYLGV